MKDLLVVVPSRGRPGNIARLAQAMDATCRGDTTLLIGLDDDDPARGEYPVFPPSGPRYEVRSGLRQVVAWINELAVPQAGNYRYIGHIGDDNVPQTEGWDVEIMEALEKTPFAFGNDHYPRTPGSLCCHVFTRSEVIARLGYFGPPGIRHMYVDVAWMAWGVRTGITYLHEVDIPHLHYTLGHPVDDSYRTSSNLIPSDLENWHDYCNSGQLNADVVKVDPQAAPFSPAELQQFNVNLGIPQHWGVPW
jgi:hypothetical protein